VDLGADVVRRLHLSPEGIFTQGEPVVVLPPGTGPRQIRLGPGRRTAYVVGELSGELITVQVHPGRAGTIVDRRPSRLTEPTGENLPAHLLVVGNRLYVSHRGLDRIAVFALEHELPTPLAEIETGPGPRHFAVCGGWLYVANELGDQVSARAMAPAAASPQPVVHFGVRRPTCVLPIG
jgi:6-phosphogluconolactonase (cycloisomerase 2 family)